MPAPIPTLSNLLELDPRKFNESPKQAFDYLSQSQEVASGGKSGLLENVIINIAYGDNNTVLFQVITPPGTMIKSVTLPNGNGSTSISVLTEAESGGAVGQEQYYSVDLTASNPKSGDWQIEFEASFDHGDDATITYEGKWVFVKSSTKPDEETV